MPLDTKHCRGCRDDFYNGRNPYGIEQCWSLANAKLVERVKIHKSQAPPYSKDQIVTVPSCYGEEGYGHVFVKPESIDWERGCWK